MQTECPSCKKRHSMTPEKLQRLEGVFTCNLCYRDFDPAEYLFEKSFFGLFQKSKSTSTKSKSTDISFSKYWTYGLAISLCIFVLQIYLFKGDALVQNKTVRPWLSSLCSATGCLLTPYKNSEEFSVLNVSFDPINKHQYTLNVSLINQAEFPQNQPAFKLTLKDFVGDVFAERIFQPQEYAKNAPTQIKPDMSTEIKLTIATPSKKIGGYHFELI